MISINFVDKGVGVKYYFADFVRKGWEEGTPQIRNLLFGPKSGFFLAKKHNF